MQKIIKLLLFSFFSIPSSQMIYGETTQQQNSHLQTFTPSQDHLKTSDQWHRSGVLAESFSVEKGEIVILTDLAGWTYDDHNSCNVIDWCQTPISKKQFKELSQQSSFYIEKGELSEIPSYCDDKEEEHQLDTE